MRVDTLVLVREARADDVPAIAELYAKAWQIAYQNLFEPKFLQRMVERGRRGWTDVLDGPGFAHQQLLVAERGPRIAAFAHLAPTVELDAVEIKAFYAHPSAWGSGVAHTLIDGVWDALADRADRVSFWTLSGFNRARRFYLTCGFTETGRTRETDYGDGRPVLEREYARDVP
jgi:RimJ/RimL family protein N-acetyltransferase